MSDHQATPTFETSQKRFKGSLAGTLVRTLLIFIVIPLSIMAGAAYYRAHNLLREQAIQQTQSLLTTQLGAVDQEIKLKEAGLQTLFKSNDFAILMELALHANPLSSEFKEIRKSVANQFQELNAAQKNLQFDQFILMDMDGNVKIASQPEWQGQKISDLSFLQNVSPENPSTISYALAPLFENQFSLLTVLEYKTTRGSSLGYLVGVTDASQMEEVLRPIHALSPLASAYFILPAGEFVSIDPASSDFKRVDAVSKSQQEILVPALAELKQSGSVTPAPYEVSLANGTETLTQLQWFPSLHAGVAISVDANTVYGGLNSLASFITWLVVLILLATSLIVFFAINRITKPLRNLAVITKQFAEGNWDSRATVQSRDEVGLLANSYNHMADELTRAHRSLENAADERSRQMRTAAEVAQNITSSAKLGDVFNQIVELLVKQFGFYQASIYLADLNGKNVVFKTGYGAATESLKEHGYQVEVGAASIIGWTSANNQTRVASRTQGAQEFLRSELFPEANSEAVVPISIGSLVLGALDIQSVQADAFTDETIIMLKTLASQVATAIQNTGLSEATQVNFDELSRLYRSSRLIARAATEDEILKISAETLEKSPYVTILLALTPTAIQLIGASNQLGESARLKVPNSINLAPDEIQAALTDGTQVTSHLAELPETIRAFIDPFNLATVALLAIRKAGALHALLIIGSDEIKANNAFIQPYENFADLISISLEKAEAENLTEQHLKEVESLALISEAISTSSDLSNFFAILHEKIKQIVGDFSFVVSLYDERNDTISVPFSYENGEMLSFESFPRGEGITSVLLRTRQPLMLLEDTEARVTALGAKVQGRLPKSLMGVPMLVQNKPVGALLIQDVEHEHAFTNENLIFFTTLASQVAGVVNNVRLLEESNTRAVQLETAAEIARDISGSLNLDELLIKAVNLIYERFAFYHAAVFLKDASNEFAVIREATGDAGAQLKRAGHKIGVGSKSIVGFVSGRGERLVVNDTSKDVTYYANPMLPDTRAEAAFPLKVGERILGVLDVQSVKPYAFTEDRLKSLQVLADQIAIAVVNTELFAETQEHLSQHRLLHHITTTAASGTTLEEALESAVTGLQVTLGGDRVTILLADREKKNLEIKAAKGYSEDITKFTVPFGEGVTGWSAANRRLLRVRDVAEDSRYIEVSSNTRSELAIPLIYRNELLGVLNVESEKVNAYTENDEEMLGTLGGSLAAIIANARLLEQIRQQIERERIVYEVTSKIRRSTDIQSILTTTASELTRITGSKQTKIKIEPENGTKPKEGR
ncbi:MAG: GAF domain-containing protein [Anaerolineales bacterium]|nr:GAF domain-containing protein [Anaerolineales bacterium]